MDVNCGVLKTVTFWREKLHTWRDKRCPRVGRHGTRDAALPDDHRVRARLLAPRQQLLAASLFPCGRYRFDEKTKGPDELTFFEKW